METLKIDKRQSGLKSRSQITKIFVNDSKPRPDDVYCGLLNFIGQQGDTYNYSVIGRGCVWIYLTDCQGNVEAGQEYNCIPGNTLQVEGCHSFGCGC
jgi:hypothetical protein